MPPRSSAAARTASRCDSVGGPGVDDVGRVGAHHVGVRALERHRPGIRRDDPDDLGMTRRGVDGREYSRPPMPDRWVTFDCYGTLIDWEGGLRDAFAALWARGRQPIDCCAFTTRRAPRPGAWRAHLQRGAGSLPGRRVGDRRPPGARGPRGRPRRIASILATLSRGAGRARPAAGARLASGHPLEHRPRPARRLGRGDRGALRRADHRQRGGSYKPAPGHWERFFADTGAAPEHHVHVAASLFHDVEPAARMGLETVWINRLGESSSLPRAAELPDLARPTRGPRRTAGRPVEQRVLACRSLPRARPCERPPARGRPGRRRP